MGTLLSIIVWALGIAIVALVVIGILFIKFLIFKWKCDYLADTIAEKIGEVLDERDRPEMGAEE